MKIRYIIIALIAAEVIFLGISWYMEIQHSEKLSDTSFEVEEEVTDIDFYSSDFNFKKGKCPDKFSIELELENDDIYIPEKKVVKQFDVQFGYLELKQLKLDSIPIDLISKECIESLNLNHNYISELSTELTSMKSLNYLFLDNNNIEIDGYVGEFPALKELVLSNNLIKSFSYKNMNARKLEILDLSGNLDLSEIDIHYTHFPNLKTIRLNNTEIADDKGSIDRLRKSFFNVEIIY